MPRLYTFSLASTVFALPFALIFTMLFFARIEHRSRECALASAFIETILCVFSSGAMPKMFRIYAPGIVAAMTDFSSWRNWPFELFKNKSMSQSGSLLAVFSPNDLAIAKVCAWAVCLPGVVPATGFEIDFNPKKDALPWKK